MKNKRIALSLPHLGGSEKKYVNEAIESGWIVPLGPNVDSFENNLEDYLGQEVKVAALSSGTAALHLGLILMGVKKGDEVICQSMTFSASANPIVYQGATPVFVDSETESWNICPKYLEVAIKNRISRGRKPKAIIPVHLYGMPALMDEIMDIANHYEIPVLEDAAEALGSTVNGQKCGTIGQMACLSFNGNKIITTSGGGALVTKSEVSNQRAKFFATQAKDDAPHYQHSQIGYNYRMSNLVAGLGRGQMEVLDSWIEKRRNNFTIYKKELQEISGISFQEELGKNYSNRWLSTILINPELTNGITREDVRLCLQEKNIETRPLWKPMHLQPVFQNCPYFGGKVSDDFFENGLCLPSSSSLSEDEIYRVIEEIKHILKS